MATELKPTTKAERDKMLGFAQFGSSGDAVNICRLIADIDRRDVLLRRLVDVCDWARGDDMGIIRDIADQAAKEIEP